MKQDDDPIASIVNAHNEKQNQKLKLLLFNPFVVICLAGAVVLLYNLGFEQLIGWVWYALALFVMYVFVGFFFMKKLDSVKKSGKKYQYYALNVSIFLLAMLIFHLFLWATMNATNLPPYCEKNAWGYKICY